MAKNKAIKKKKAARKKSSGDKIRNMKVNGCRYSNPDHVLNDIGEAIIPIYNFKKAYESKCGWFEFNYYQVPILSEKKYSGDCGLLMYFLYDGTNFYATIDPVSNFYAVPPSPSRTSDYYVANASYRFAPEDIANLDTLIAKIKGDYNDPVPEGRPHDFPRNINAFNTEFKRQFKSSEFPRGIAAGFFHTDEVRLMQGRNLYNGMRIFWGYEEGNSYCKIRLVAFGINSLNNKNLYDMTNGEIVLEQSWPPEA